MIFAPNRPVQDSSFGELNFCPVSFIPPTFPLCHSISTHHNTRRRTAVSTPPNLLPTPHVTPFFPAFPPLFVRPSRRCLRPSWQKCILSSFFVPYLSFAALLLLLIYASACLSMTRWRFVPICSPINSFFPKVVTSSVITLLVVLLTLQVEWLLEPSPGGQPVEHGRVLSPFLSPSELVCHACL